LLTNEQMSTHAGTLGTLYASLVLHTLRPAIQKYNGSPRFLM